MKIIKRGNKTNTDNKWGLFLISCQCPNEAKKLNQTDWQIDGPIDRLLGRILPLPNVPAYPLIELSSACVILCWHCVDIVLILGWSCGWSCGWFFGMFLVCFCIGQLHLPDFADLVLHSKCLILTLTKFWSYLVRAVEITKHTSILLNWTKCGPKFCQTYLSLR